MASDSRHVYHLKAGKAKHQSELGSIQPCTADELPILKGMSLKRLVLEPKAIREPHWHANTIELTYCLRGNALVSMLDTGSAFATFTIRSGEMFHVESGSLHTIENVSDTEPAEFIVCFRHERPEDFSLRESMGAMTPGVLGNTYNLPTEALAKIDLSAPHNGTEIIARTGPATIPSTARLPSKHKFSVENMEPPLKGEGVGHVKPARSQFWPTLHSLAMYSLTIADTGMREPHWHPVTSELGYVDRGQARMTVLDPDGSVDTYTLRPGDMYFVPPAYPHQIEVLPEGGEDIHFCIFFDQPMPQDIGYKASLTAVPHEAMAATLSLKTEALARFEGATTDPLMVKRINPVEPVQHWTK